MEADRTIVKLAADRVVDNRVYTDPAVFDRERDRIFDRVWDFVCHTSEIAKSGDYFTYTLVDVPVLVVRGRDDEIRAFHNTCRHRGSVLTDDPTGHCTAFRCPYHAWVYSLQGELVSIPGEEAYEGSGFEKEHFPLVPIRCEVIDGLVFVNLDDGAEPLSEWLGPEVIEILATPLGRGDYSILETNQIDLPVNWKVPSENGRDGYHVPFVHPFFRKASPPLEYFLYRNGHAVQYLGMDPNGIEPEDWAQLKQHPLPGLGPGDGYILTIWPNLWVTVRSNVVSIDTLRIGDVARTVMDHRSLGLVDDDDDKKAVRVFSQARWFSDPILKEDVPVFLKQQRGVQNRFVRYSVVARGKDAMSGSRGDDNRLRHFWTEWRVLMGSDTNALSD